MFKTQSNAYIDKAHIENCFLDFYSNLWSKYQSHNFNNLLYLLPSYHNRISDFDFILLSKPMTKLKDLKPFYSLASGRSPSPDELNADFYHFFWHDIEDHLFNGVNHFFCTTSLPTSWCNTYVALISMCDNPKLVTDNQPISLCNVCYKIVSKIITNKIRAILLNLIGQERFGLLLVILLRTILL